MWITTTIIDLAGACRQPSLSQPFGTYCIRCHVANEWRKRYDNALFLGPRHIGVKIATYDLEVAIRSTDRHGSERSTKA
jgi:hypothetical protein